MHRTQVLPVGCLVGLVLSQVALKPAFAQCPVVDLGSLGCGQTNVRDGLGYATGGSCATGGGHAFRWQGGTMLDLGTLGGATSGANGVNTSGDVVGFSLNAAGQTRGFFWSAGTMTALGTLGGATSVATSVNNTDVVVGYSLTGGFFPQTRGFKWTSSAGLTDLGTLGGNYSIARRINNAGTIVGGAKNAAGTLLPSYYSTVGSGWTAFTLPAGFTSGEASDISETNVWPSSNRWTVGYAINSSGVAKAVRWNGLTTPTLLPDLFGPSNPSYAIAISPSGLYIVGIAYDAGGNARAFRWYNPSGIVSDPGLIQDLTAMLPMPACLGWVLREAVGVTDAGVVFGNAKQNLVDRAFTLLPP